MEITVKKIKKKLQIAMSKFGIIHGQPLNDFGKHIIGISEDAYEKNS